MSDNIKEGVAVALIVLLVALGIALIVATPIGIITLGNSHHDSACTSLRTEADRLACLTGGTVQDHEVAACEGIQSYSTSAFNVCMAQITGESFSTQRSSAAASGLAVGGN